MKNLFYQGGPLFMGILTILFVVTIAWFVYHLSVSSKSQQINREKLLRLFGFGKSMGMLALVTGVLGQMVGLTSMFMAIEHAIQRGEEIVPSLVFGGIKATMIVTIYGLLIYLVSLLLWFLSSMLVEKKLK